MKPQLVTCSRLYRPFEGSFPDRMLYNKDTSHLDDSDRQYSLHACLFMYICTYNVQLSPCYLQIFHF